VSEVDVVSLAERPDLLEAFWSVPADWPEFMFHDPVAALFYARAVEQFPDLHRVAMDADAVVGRLHAVPIPWPGRDALPERGWDWALTAAAEVPVGRREAVSLIEARVTPARRGQGLSRQLLAGARRRFAAQGTRDLVGPVRPTGKSSEPRAPAEEYARRTRPDGLPRDPWLRVHVRLGGRIVGMAPLSMTIAGTVAQWREWTGLPFDTGGSVEVAGALAPVHVDPAQDHAVYVEANVWVHHDLATAGD
jgi:GNAT superfamily N-acetyltransferase